MHFEAVYSDILEFDESEQAEGLKIKGTAFRSGAIESKRVFIPSSELRIITETLAGSVILTDHSTSVRDICGRVDESWIDGEKVRFKGTILDEEIAKKIVKGLISKASVGLHVEEMELFDYQGEEYQLLKGIRARELSLVVYPAVAEASFVPSFTFSEVTINEPDCVDSQISETDMGLIETILVNRGDKIVLGRSDFEMIQNELKEKRAEYERLSKHLWVLSNCDETFIENIIDKTDSISLDQIEFLWEAYKDLKTKTEGAQGVVSEEKGSPSIDTTKEDIRQLIFHRRKLGKWRDDLKDLRDINI